MGGEVEWVRDRTARGVQAGVCTLWRVCQKWCVQEGQTE